MVIEATPRSFVVQSPEGIIYANTGFRDLIDHHSTDEIYGTQLTAFVAPECHEALEAQLNKIRTGEAPTLGLSVLVEDSAGHQREVIAISSQTQWQETTQVQTTFIPIADNGPKSAFTLRDRAIDAAPVGVTIASATEPDLPVIYANEGFVRMTGYPRDEILGQNCRFLQGPETREESVARIRTAVKNKEPATVELRNYRKDGSMFWNRLTVTPIENSAGAVTHYFGFQQDISGKKLYEREKTLFETQAEVSEHAIFITDAEGTIEYVNPAFERRTGYTAAEAIGQTPRILKSGHHDDRFYQELWDTITAGEIWSGELTNQTKSGELYEVSVRIVPVTNEQGAITHYAAIEQDITESVLKDQILDVLNRILRHNLRTALTVISGQTEILAGDIEHSNPHAAIATIQDQTTSLQKIADKTAKLQHLRKQDRQGVVWERADIEDAVAAYRDQYPEADIMVEFAIDANVYLSNAELFELALDEAIENAVQHTDAASPEVRITITELPESQMLQLTVADDGPGIPDNERLTIEDGREIPLRHGTGIGLWIMEWMTTHLGGDLTIDTKPSGTVLLFQLPNKSPKSLDD